MYPNGEVQWNFMQMDFESYSEDMFTGVYDNEEGTLYNAGFAIDEVSSYGGDFSGAGEFELVESLNQNIGLDLDNVADSSFIGNSIRASQWVYGAGLENVSFNDNDSGNTYYLLNGDGAWTIFDITDSTGNGYADSGTNRPFNEEMLGVEYWEGEGQDLYPATENESAVVATRRSSGSSSPRSRALAQKAFDDYYAKKGVEQDDNDDNDEESSESSEAPTQSSTPLGAGVCPIDQQVTQNLKQGAVDGRTHAYTQGVVKDVALVQAHINRILAGYFNEAAGPVDGWFGPMTKQGVQRLQAALRDQQGADLGPAGTDGVVGPMTRAAINGSCEQGEE
jgi:peptidoglycan hydrolase-like protein with peptidoglycan-binding domain